MSNSSENSTRIKSYSPWLIAFVVMLPTAMEVLDTSIANVVLPYIAGDLGVSVDKSSWMITTYLVANAIILPITGWLSDILGRKKYFILSIAIFTASSFMCGISSSLNELLLFRAIQGIGGGGLMPLSQAILLEHFPDEKRSIGMGIYGMGVILAPIFGPMLGGWIADNYPWGWIFLINIPVGLISIGLVYLFIEKYEVKKDSRKAIDYIGLSALSIGIASLQLFLDKGQRYDWFSSNFIVVSFSLAIICISFTVIWELKCKNPIIDLRMLKDKNFLIGVVSMFIIGLTFYGVNEAIPLFLQNLMGYTAFLSGLVIGVSGVVVFFGMPIAGILGSKFNPKWIVITGWIIVAYALLRMTSFSLNIDFWGVASVRAIMGIGISFIFVPMNAAAFMFVKESKIEYGTGLINLTRNIGGSVGIALINTIVARKDQLHQSFLSENITPLNTIFLENYEILKNGLHMSSQEAIQLMYNQIQQQSMMLSYLDGFWLLFIIMLFSLPILFILKNKINSNQTDKRGVYEEIGF